MRHIKTASALIVFLVAFGTLVQAGSFCGGCAAGGVAGEATETINEEEVEGDL